MNSIVEEFEYLSQKYKSCIAIKDDITGYSLTFQEFNQNINKIVQILNKINIDKKEKIIIFLKNHPLWHVIDLAIMKNHNVSIPCDPISSFEEIKNILQQTGSKVIFTDNIKFINNIKADENITIFYVGNIDAETSKNVYNLEKELKNTKYEDIVFKLDNPDEIASILFSSGTMGVPKGVMLSHKNLFLALQDHKKIFAFKKQEQKNCVSILSPSHISPRFNTLALLTGGNTIIYSDYINYFETVKKYKPNYLLCVPKLLDIFIEEYKKELLNKTELFQFFHNIFFGISKIYIKNRRNFLGFILSIFYFTGYKYFFKQVMNKILNLSTTIFTAGALLHEYSELFFNIMGMNLIVQYGLTESCVYISSGTLTNNKVGSVGKLNSNIDIIICNCETGEKLGYNKTGLIKVKGDQIMKGYYNDAEKTKEAFDDKGYLITGDLGYLTKDNYLYFKGRQKDVIVLSNGKNINLNRLERICKDSKFIKQIVVCGQDRPYLTALVVIDNNYVNEFLKDNKEKDLKKEILIDINNLIGNDKYFKWIEQIKDIRYIDKEFSYENGFLTKKYSLKRNKIYDVYKDLINDMY